MDWRYLGVLAVLMLVVASLGCLNPPAPPPISRIPKVIVDYVDGEGFAIYVHGMSDYRYERIVIKVDNRTLYDRNRTFQATALTKSENFTLNITVLDLPEEGSDIETYYYNATVLMNPPLPEYTVTDQSGTHRIDLEGTTYFITTMYLSKTEPKK